MRVAAGPLPRRKGTVLPMLAVCLIAIFGFVALAIDLGMLALSRTRCQNAADVAALTGCRQLNNKPGVTNSNLAQAVATARAAVTSNRHLNSNFTNAQIQQIQVGQFLYNTSAQTFSVGTWYDVTNSTSVTPPGGSWTALRVTVSVSQPTYFMRVFGVNTMPTGAVAAAVYRPRDIAFAIDMTGSMMFGSVFLFNGQSLNPDTLVPQFGHYISTQSNLIATTNRANSDGEAFTRNNVTIPTANGPAIVRDFYFDPANISNPATPVVTPNINNLRRALHCLPDSAETPGDPNNYVPPTYNFSSYNAFDTSRMNGPTPAPPWFGTMTDSGGVPYVGDRWRRANGSINKTNTNWSTNSTSNRAAANLIELLGYNVNNNQVRGGTSGTNVIASDMQFRDPVWEQHGYDLDIVAYRNWRGNNPPPAPGSYTAPLLPQADQYIGYSMGPGYWGKTFFIWPPDPRYDPAANVLSPNPNRPAFDTNGRPMCDWRRRFFLRPNGTPFDPQVDNDHRNSGSNSFDGINEVLFNTSGNMTLRNDVVVNYAAILRWLKTGPQTLPPNLRAGRVVYYTSIPDDVDVNTGTPEQRRDKVFWREYINYVLGIGSYTGTNNLYGGADSISPWTQNITTNDLQTWAGPQNNWPSNRPYMRYTDSPRRPRLHFWFGPLSMLGFMTQYGRQNGWNMWAGTCYESQCWQLKVAMNSVLDDVRNNHPNDYVGLAYFSHSHHNDIRVPMGQNFVRLKNALFYPSTLLAAIENGDMTTEFRPYNTGSNFNSFNNPGTSIIPNSNGATDPNTGLYLAFNLLSPSSQLPSHYTTFVNGQPVRGRRGAAKIVIFETDGVPNSWRGLNGSVNTMNPTLRGFDTFYPQSGWASGFTYNGNPTSMSEAIKVAQQIVKPMASTNGVGVDSGLSLPNAPARIYPIAFGDLFDPVVSPNATFRATALQFLANLAAVGNTGPAGATTLPEHQIITGSYQQRIERLRTCMERIFQSGVAVTLIE